MAFDLTLEGVRVWGDHLQVTLVGNEVTRVACETHAVDTNAPAMHAEEVLPGELALQRATERLPASHLQATVQTAVLTYAPAALLELRPADPQDYVLAWRFEFNAPVQGAFSSIPPCVIWVNATSGEVILVKP